MQQSKSLKWLGVVSAMALGSLVAAGMPASAQTADKPITLVYAGYLPAADPGNVIVARFVKLVAERSGGKVKIDAHYDGQLGNERESAEGVRSGTVDLVASLGTGLAQYVRPVSVLELPYLATSGSQATKVFLAAMPQVAELAKPFNFYPLTVWDLGPRTILSRKPIKSLADMKGLKIRAPAPVYIGTMAAFGANPVQLPWGEIYTSLQTGAIDAMEASPQQIYASKFQEQAKNLIVSKHMIPGHYFLINRTKWDTLAPDVQEMLKNAANDAAAEHWAKTDAAFNETLEKLKAEGVTITYPDDLSEWEAATVPFKESYASKLGKEGEDLLQRAKASN